MLLDFEALVLSRLLVPHSPCDDQNRDAREGFAQARHAGQCQGPAEADVHAIIEGLGAVAVESQVESGCLPVGCSPVGHVDAHTAHGHQGYNTNIYNIYVHIYR